MVTSCQMAAGSALHVTNNTTQRRFYVYALLGGVASTRSIWRGNSRSFAGNVTVAELGSRYLIGVRYRANATRVRVSTFLISTGYQRTHGSNLNATRKNFMATLQPQFTSVISYFLTMKYNTCIAMLVTLYPNVQRHADFASKQ